MDDNVRIFKCCSTIHLITMSKNVTKSLMIIKSTKITDRALNRQSTGFEKQFRYYSKQNGFHPTSFALFKIKREAVSYRFKLHLPSSQISEPSYQCYGGSIFVSFRSLQKQSTAPKVGFALSRTTTKGVSMIENQETLSSSLDVPTSWLRLRHLTEMKCVAFSVTIYRRRRRSSRFKFIAM